VSRPDHGLESWAGNEVLILRTPGFSCRRNRYKPSTKGFAPGIRQSKRSDASASTLAYRAISLLPVDLRCSHPRIRSSIHNSSLTHGMLLQNEGCLSLPAPPYKFLWPELQAVFDSNSPTISIRNDSARNHTTGACAKVLYKQRMTSSTCFSPAS